MIHENRQNEWKEIPSDSGPLTRIAVPDMEPGTYYYLVVDSPDKGIQTPTLLVMTPKPPSEIRVGTNINDETIVDFKPAITSQPVKKYTIQNPDVPRGVVLDGLDPDTEYAVVVAAEFVEGDNLPSEPVTVRTPPGVINHRNERIRAAELHKTGTKTAAIVRISDFKPASVYRVLKRFKETGGIQDCPLKGRSITSSTSGNIQKIRCHLSETRSVRCAKWLGKFGLGERSVRTIIKIKLKRAATRSPEFIFFGQKAERKTVSKSLSNDSFVSWCSLSNMLIYKQILMVELCTIARIVVNFSKRVSRSPVTKTMGCYYFPASVIV
ncbi:von Willebrand factor type A domain [Parelaphostrongylus tenuis]|uniref:von Willebrand factor type A domain n=1 Tax=Parelaphostrongylus tenuis TaxID=148309 RepID=A0AAD5MJB4_PARTN|nr:von Willebrand factor type A domain [Parelaphostrongylus tenuis]